MKMLVEKDKGDEAIKEVFFKMMEKLLKELYKWKTKLKKNNEQLKVKNSEQ